MAVCKLHFNFILNYTATSLLEVIIQALDLSSLTLPAFLSIRAVASTQYWISKTHLEDQELGFFVYWPKVMAPDITGTCCYGSILIKFCL